MKFRYSLLSICLLIVTASFSFAGDISPELLDRLDSISSDETVPVWIEIQNAVDGQSLKKDLTSRFSLRVDRYREAMTKLKNVHTAAQSKIMSKLTQQFNKSNRRIKRHWLVNVIEADLTKDEIYQYAAENDIVTIYLEPEIELIPVDDEEKEVEKRSAAVQSNLNFINAPQAWQLGYTGEGRIVCSFDTGVEGEHPALASRWKGLDGDSSAAWFDPTEGEMFPHIFPSCGCNTSHGTHTMGIMVGVNPLTNDTIGVAPGAKWISAGVLDIPGASFLDAFEWAADPDRNPNTISDVPDVINHSWGLIFNGLCDNIFYDMIDNTEALGIVNIFSAGNEGGFGAETIRNPANRALDSLDCFAVGNINDANGIVFSTSSRGPTDCPMPAIKPNVVAPGYQIYSSIPNGNYSNLIGTSMAAPHVSGLVALLRQKNPNATVDEIKNAILLSADNNGETVPNNNIGWGVIDCAAALALISDTVSTPLIKIYRLEHDPIVAGDTITASLVLKNFGQQAFSVNTTVINSNSAITVVNGNASFGTMMQNDTAVGSADLVFVLDDTVTTGSTLYTTIQVTASGYSIDLKLALSIPPFDNNKLLTHTAGDIHLTISSYGSYGYGSGTPVGGGSGFTYKDGGNDLWTAGFMIGKIPTYVSDGATDGSGDFDGDFTVLPSSELSFVAPKPGVSEQSYTRYTDTRARIPMGLNVTQEVYSFDYAPYLDFIIMRFIVQNISDSNLTNLYAGLCFDWDVPPYNSNAGGYESVDEFLWIGYNNGSEIIDYRGLKLLEPSLSTAYTGRGDNTYPPNAYTDPEDGFSEFEKITALTNGIISADTYKNVQLDLFQIAAAQLALSSQQIDTVAFALLAGDTYADIQAAASNASTAYNGIVTDVDEIGGPDELPQRFILSQNYPNPFNPSTTIEFSLPKKSACTFEVFNLLGQKVYQEKNILAAGAHKIVWDGSDYSSGVYLYKLSTDNFNDTKKMVLLK